MKKQNLKKLSNLELVSGHKFIKHDEKCGCTLCVNNIKVCKVCGGSESETYNSLTTNCTETSLSPAQLDEINSGLKDFDTKGWFNAAEKLEPSVLDVAIMPIGTLIKSNLGIEFVVFAHYENARGKCGVRLIETAEHMQANPDIRSYIFASTMAPWFPVFEESYKAWMEGVEEKLKK